MTEDAERQFLVSLTEIATNQTNTHKAVEGLGAEIKSLRDDGCTVGAVCNSRLDAEEQATRDLWKAVNNDEARPRRGRGVAVIGASGALGGLLTWLANWIGMKFGG